MERKICLTACLSAMIMLPACTYNRATEPVGPVQQDYCVGGVCETDPFINYTETRANFREYGELSPRDHLVSQAAAGNNLTAAVAPSIEDEVISYEERIDVVPAEQISEAAPQEVITEVSVENQPSEQQVSTNEVLDGESSQPKNTDENTAESSATEEVVVAVQEEETKQPDVEEEYYDEDVVRDWYAEEGQNLKALLTEWSEKSGWRLVWNSNRNYVLNAGAMFRGRFADVSSALIRAFARARPAPVATFYKGNRVLVVETMEDENAFD